MSEMSWLLALLTRAMAYNSTQEALTSSWWEWGLQIAASAFTILAAISTMVALCIAYASLRRMKQQWAESIAPDWELLGPTYSERVDSTYIQTNVELLNIGSGPAKNTCVEAGIGCTVRNITWNAFYKSNPALIAPLGVLTISFDWPANAPPLGLLKIKCETRFGDTVHHYLYVQCATDEDNHIHCSVTKLADSYKKNKKITG